MLLRTVATGVTTDVVGYWADGEDEEGLALPHARLAHTALCGMLPPPARALLCGTHRCWRAFLSLAQSPHPPQGDGGVLSPDLDPFELTRILRLRLR